MAGRLSAAADEEFLLPGLGRQHGARRSGHDCGAVCEGPRHGAGHRAGSFLPAAEYFAAECGGDQLGRRSYSRHGHRGEHFHHSHSGRRAFADYDGMGRRSAHVAGRFCFAGDCDGDFLGDPVLRHAICAGTAAQ